MSCYKKQVNNKMHLFKSSLTTQKLLVVKGLMLPDVSSYHVPVNIPWEQRPLIGSVNQTCLPGFWSISINGWAEPAGKSALTAVESQGAQKRKKGDRGIYSGSNFFSYHLTLVMLLTYFYWPCTAQNFKLPEFFCVWLPMAGILFATALGCWVPFPQSFSSFAQARI
jgi:hypothetical protein